MCAVVADPKSYNGILTREEDEMLSSRGVLNHVLVVDDENGPRQALRMLLKETYTVHVVDSARAALEVLEKEPIGVVISDIRMPKVSGVDLLQMIRERYDNVQVVMMTGYGELKTAMKSVEFGAFSYIEKPFDTDIMLDTVAAAYARFTQDRERRALEDLALEASRFETLGRLVSGTMHDLGTPLTVLNSQLELMSMKLDREPADLEKRIATMRSQVAYCTEITRNTMDYLRHEKGVSGPLSLNELVSTSVSVARPYFRETSVEYHLDLTANLPLILVESVLVRQSIMNVMNNACQAMAEKTEVGKRNLYIRTSLDEGMVVLEIEDSGPGIAPVVREHIFEMFYSTKGDKGTGLGLGVVSNVMSRCGGGVALVEGRQGSGACFRLSFPATEAAGPVS